MNGHGLILSKPKALFPPLALVLGGLLFLSGCATTAGVKLSDREKAIYQAHIKRGSQFLADKEFREALRLNPNDPVAHTGLGYVLICQGKHKEAEQEFREAVWLKPDYSEAHNGLGKAFRMQFKYDQAENEFRVALQLDSKNAIAHNRLGHLLTIKRKQLDEAERHLRMAIKLMPDYSEALLNLAWLMDIQKRPEEAKILRARGEEAKKKVFWYTPKPEP